MRTKNYHHWFTLLISLSVLYTPITIGESSPIRGIQDRIHFSLPSLKSYRAPLQLAAADNSATNPTSSVYPSNSTNQEQSRRPIRGPGGMRLPFTSAAPAATASEQQGLRSATQPAEEEADADAEDEDLDDNDTIISPAPYPPNPAPAVKLKGNQQLWNLKNVDIRTVISRVSKETGKNFVIDPRVQGKVTLVTQKQLKPQELYQMFLAVLQVNGFSAIDANGIVRIVRDQDIKSLAGPVTEFPQIHFPDENIVKVIHVEHVPVRDLQVALKPLVPNSAYITANAPSNDIVVSDRASNVARIAKVIKQLDKPWTDGSEIIKLRHASPTEVVTIIEGLREGSRARNEAPISLAADERTNSIIMSGPPSKRLQIRAMIASLDVDSSYEGNLHVVYLKYIRAKDIAPIIANILQTYEVQTQSARGTSRSAATAPNFGARAEPSANDAFGAFSRYGMGAGAGGGAGGSSGGGLSNLEQQNAQLFEKSESREKSGGSGAVQWEETTNAIIIKASPTLMRMLRSVIAKLDIRRPQVLVETIIAEVDVDRAKDLGVEWNTGGDVAFRTRFPSTGLSSIGGRLGGAGFSTATSLDQAIGGLIPGSGLTLGFFHHGNLRALVRAIESNSLNNVLATPNIITLDNETANIKVGEKVPFLTGITNNEVGTINSFQREEVGLSLTIRPQITQSGAIKMQINHVLSNVIEGTQDQNSGGNPRTSERIITTNVVVDDGQILVLGGLIRNDWVKNTSKIPLLGDIPGVGKLFRSDDRSIVKRNLMVFIRPVILRDNNDNIEVTTGKYNHIRQLQLDSLHEFPLPNESPASAQLDEPKDLPLPFQLEYANIPGK